MWRPARTCAHHLPPCCCEGREMVWPRGMDRAPAGRRQAGLGGSSGPRRQRRSGRCRWPGRSRGSLGMPAAAPSWLWARSPPGGAAAWHEPPQTLEKSAPSGSPHGSPHVRAAAPQAEERGQRQPFRDRGQATGDLPSAWKIFPSTRCVWPEEPHVHAMRLAFVGVVTQDVACLMSAPRLRSLPVRPVRRSRLSPMRAVWSW